MFFSEHSVETVKWLGKVFTVSSKRFTHHHVYTDYHKYNILCKPNKSCRGCLQKNIKFLQILSCYISKPTLSSNFQDTWATENVRISRQVHRCSVTVVHTYVMYFVKVINRLILASFDNVSIFAIRLIKVIIFEYNFAKKHRRPIAASRKSGTTLVIRNWNVSTPTQNIDRFLCCTVYVIKQQTSAHKIIRRYHLSLVDISDNTNSPVWFSFWFIF